jgi:hypothetical protein
LRETVWRERIRCFGGLKNDCGQELSIEKDRLRRKEEKRALEIREARETRPWPEIGK